MTAWTEDDGQDLIALIDAAFAALEAGVSTPSRRVLG
jgi:hypothetical protein